MAYSRAQAMLLGIAIGHAFGAGYEFYPGGRAAVATDLDVSRYRTHPNPKFAHECGHYTDDTQMSAAVAEVLASGAVASPAILADAVVLAYRRDPIPGYSRKLEAALGGAATGADFRAHLDVHSTGNGAAMRAIPFGVLPELGLVVESAVVSARLTHDTPSGRASSLTVALAAHHLYHGGSIDTLLETVEPWTRRADPESADHLKAVWALEHEAPLTLFGPDAVDTGLLCDGRRTAGAALYVLHRAGRDPLETLTRAVLLGGDTDSVSAIALGLTAIASGLDSLPAFLLADLTNHAYGKDYLTALGARLGDRYPP